MRRLLLAIGFLLSATVAQAATCYISEFPGGPPTGLQVAPQPALTEQTVAIGGSSTQSAAFSGDTKMIRLHCDAIASFKFGTNPTATTSSARIPADGIEYFVVRPGDKIAVITNS